MQRKSADSAMILAGVLTQIFIEKALQTLYSDSIYLDEWATVSRTDILKHYTKFCERHGMRYWIELAVVPFIFAVLTMIKVRECKIRRGITVFVAVLVLNMSVCDFGFYAVLCASQGTDYNFFLEGINPANLCVVITLIVLGLSPIIIIFMVICSSEKSTDMETTTTIPEHINIIADTPGSDRWASTRYPTAPPCEQLG